MAATCTVTTERLGERTLVHISGAFDRGCALELRDRIDGDPASELVLDFSLVRDFADLAVATLAAGLASSRRRVALRGLRTHQLRLFRYFGVELDGHDVADDDLAVVSPGAAARPPAAH